MHSSRALLHLQTTEKPWALLTTLGSKHPRELASASHSALEFCSTLHCFRVFSGWCLWSAISLRCENRTKNPLWICCHVCLLKDAKYIMPQTCTQIPLSSYNCFPLLCIYLCVHMHTCGFTYMTERNCKNIFIVPLGRVGMLKKKKKTAAKAVMNSWYNQVPQLLDCDVCRRFQVYIVAKTVACVHTSRA